MATGLRLSTDLASPTSPRSRPKSSTHSAFHFPSSSGSSTADDEAVDPDAPLPFPTALARRDFLAPDFNAAAYLSSLFPSTTDPGASTLAQRHQTLEDLRTELRERSSAISAELLELVNSNYTSFLGLGDELKGGEERVEDVRVALLGFRRQVEEIRGRVRGRKEDVGRVSGVLREVRGDIEAGRRMLELDERLEVLQGTLEAGNAEDDDDRSDDTEDEESDDARGEGGFKESSPPRLMVLAREYSAVEKLAEAIGRDLPYVKKMEERITRCRNTLLLDLGTSMKEAQRAGDKGHDRVLKFLAIYRALGAHAEGVKILKER